MFLIFIVLRGFLKNVNKATKNKYCERELSCSRRVGCNLHTSIPSTITGSPEVAFKGDIIDDDDTFGNFTKLIFLITNGTLPVEEFPFTSKSNPRKLDMNSMANRENQFQAFIEHCATDVLKYEFFDVYFSHIDDRSLETNVKVE